MKTKSSSSCLDNDSFAVETHDQFIKVFGVMWVETN